ncbi:hypothetical protein PR048_032695 [Dryococelus australis]|uniref:RNA-directed DNA polymerase n=1 Tax=Dryococelus australis TaxID=614101 RepID=A0ABQ9G716_9NEOP|nr:hypothetical protein PR048_032695 [Dryococelus australis]
MKSLQEENTSETDYIIESGILFHGQRVFVPASLQSAVLNELHRTHVGITKMKQLARRYVYWKKTDSDIEHLVRIQPKSPSHPWEEPEHKWQRTHIDYAGPYQDHHFLVVVDAKSKWAEIVPCLSAPTSKKGFPEVMVPENTTILTSEEFAHFCKQAGIFQKFCAAGHPAINGLAEYNVQKLKHRLTTTHIDQLRSTEIPLPSMKTVHFDPKPKSPMSDDRQLNKPNLGDLTEIMDPDVVLPEAKQPDPIEQEEEVLVVDFQPPEQPAQREHRLPAYLRDYSLY